MYVALLLHPKAMILDFTIYYFLNTTISLSLGVGPRRHLECACVHTHISSSSSSSSSFITAMSPLQEVA